MIKIELTLIVDKNYIKNNIINKKSLFLKFLKNFLFLAIIIEIILINKLLIIILFI